MSESVEQAVMYNRRNAKDTNRGTIYIMRDGKTTTDREVALQASEDSKKETKP